MRTTPDATEKQYNGLTVLTRGLPAEAYFDTGRHQLELQRIWYRHWIYVGRSSEVPLPRAYRTFELGDQRLMLVRDEHGVLQGFHNTCRHRGAALCLENSGVLRTGAIVCPYHAWTYSLQGDLLRTSSKRHAEGFEVADYPLYRVPVHEWRGFVFVTLSEHPPPFAPSFDPLPQCFDAWPLEELTTGHVLDKVIQCNWKIFWENYNECLHCPAVHPQLSQLVPIYGRGIMDERDDPNWAHHAADPHPKFKGGLRTDASTWSLDGQVTGVPFPLSEKVRKEGALYMTALPSVFIVGHVDYVRVVRLRPLGPERTELKVEYLFSRETLAHPRFDMRNIIEFTDLVMTEDAEVCELNQRGLKAVPHVGGVVMPEEYLIRQFHEWIAAELERV